MNPAEFNCPLCDERLDYYMSGSDKSNPAILYHSFRCYSFHPVHVGVTFSFLEGELIHVRHTCITCGGVGFLDSAPANICPDCDGSQMQVITGEEAERLIPHRPFTAIVYRQDGDTRKRYKTMEEAIGYVIGQLGDVRTGAVITGTYAKFKVNGEQVARIEYKKRGE